MEFVEPNADMEIEINTLCLEKKAIKENYVFSWKTRDWKVNFYPLIKIETEYIFKNPCFNRCSEIIKDNTLSELLDEIKNISGEAIEKKDKGPTAKTCRDLMREIIKSFFRNLNGVLRKSPLLVIWPVTEKREVDEMLILKGKEVLNFTGPQTDNFIDIAKEHYR